MNQLDHNTQIVSMSEGTTDGSTFRLTDSYMSVYIFYEL